MGTIIRDLKYGFRMLAKSPGFTAVAVVTLALGIGANANIFTAVEAMLLRPFAFKGISRTETVWETSPKQDAYHATVAPADFIDWRNRNRGFDLLAAGRYWNANLTGNGLAQRVEGYRVTQDFFPLIGLPAELGRGLTADDFQPGHASVVVFSHRFWRRMLGGDPTIVGKSVLLNGETFDVVGIMPEDCDFPVGMEAWTPLDLSGAAGADRATHDLQVIGHLKPGVSLQKAEADLAGIASALAHDYPKTNANHGVRLVNVVDDLTEGSRQFLSTLVGGALFVLLLACANVANLQLSRATSREKEIAVRRALGASRWQIARQLLGESITLALMGGLAGLVLAYWALDVTLREVPPFIIAHVAGLKHETVDGTTILFTVGLALLSGILSGIAPALHFSRPDLSETLKEGSRGGTGSPARRRIRALLVVSEVALALLLLVGAGAMAKGFGNLINSEQGFDRSNVLTFRVTLPANKYGDSARVRAFYDSVVERMRALPGVESVATVTAAPGRWDGWPWSMYTGEGQPPTPPGVSRDAASQAVSAEFFRVMRIPLIEGRVITDQDGPTSPLVAVISRGLAQQIWPHEDPLGKHIKLDRAESPEPWRTIVGVVGDVKAYAFDPNPTRVIYTPFAQMPSADSTVMARTPGDPIALAAPARAIVRSIDSEEPPYDMRTLDQLVTDNTSGVEFSAKMMIADGFIALILAAAGIFALTAYSVAQRTHEIGVRMALGASRTEVLRMVVGYALKLTVIGLAIAIPCSIGMTTALSHLLFGIVRTDYITLSAFTLILCVVAVLSAYFPARRAASVDPLVALRHE